MIKLKKKTVKFKADKVKDDVIKSLLNSLKGDDFASSYQQNDSWAKLRQYEKAINCQVSLSNS